MLRESPDGIDIEFEEDGSGYGSLVPNPAEQLPLEVWSSDEACITFDKHGAEVAYWWYNDWETDPKMIVWMVEQMVKAYERPEQALKEDFPGTDMEMFYDREYPNDDVSCKDTLATTDGHGPSRKLPALDGHEPIEPSETPLTVEWKDEYANDPPSVVRILDGDEVLNEWMIETGGDEKAPRKRGADIAYEVRLAYERPWILRS